MSRFPLSPRPDSDLNWMISVFISLVRMCVRYWVDLGIVWAQALTARPLRFTRHLNAAVSLSPAVPLILACCTTLPSFAPPLSASLWPAPPSTSTLSPPPRYIRLTQLLKACHTVLRTIPTAKTLPLERILITIKHQTTNTSEALISARGGAKFKTAVGRLRPRASMFYCDLVCGLPVSCPSLPIVRH